ncbi:response regulator [Hymenobacter sp. NBH84]|uniref:ATP-binding protein n=1 Tax=Hymenobacter sp. NBH84 TaxID=2596915 RepID=UPI0016283FD7|nr:ATP-binding protein [Hymenobacter sp. NBH84]QNE38054.1 response regulator [Hymenobacter sp. NBH84]
MMSTSSPVLAPIDAATRIAELEQALLVANERAAAAERRLAEATAANSKTSGFGIDQVLYDLPAPVAAHDLHGRLRFCNLAFALLVQRPMTSLVNQLLSEVIPTAELPAYLAQVGAPGQPLTGQLSLLPIANKQPRQLLYRAQRLDPPSQAPYVLLCALDVTEQAQTTAELRRGKEKAEASAQAKEAFLANLSHEIRTPMNGVLGMARQLTKTPLDQGQQELLRIIQTSGEHLLAVLNEVLDMTKISSARLELEQMSFDLRESMEVALQPLAVQAAEKGLLFHATLLLQREPLPRVMGDAYRLNQVLINLVSNAIKFTSAGGSISVGGYLLSQTDTHLTAGFRVTDTGIGIPENKLDHIFEDFVQAGTDTARRYGGTGLGLGIARALVEQMGGTIQVESQVESGSTFQFTVTLPRAEGVETTPRPVLTDTGALRNRRVLVVEDNGINREVVRRLLQGWGVQVDEAEDGPTALLLHTENLYDAVLMDIQMPGMSGAEATTHIRLHPDSARAQVPVLALTANAFRSDLDRYLKAGINDCLTKPFKEEEFYHKLVGLLQLPTTPYDLAQVYELADGEKTFVQRMVRSFLLHIPPSLQQMQAAAAAEHWMEVARLVHHIKPNLIQFGVAGIAQPLHLLIDPPRPGAEDQKYRAAAMQQLIRQVEQVVSELAAEMAA